MATKFTCSNGTSEVERYFPDPALKLCVECPPAGSNTFCEKRVDQIVVGDRICHYPGKPGPSLEVTLVEVV